MVSPYKINLSNASHQTLWSSALFTQFQSRVRALKNNSLLSFQIEETIKKDILSGRLKVGQKVSIHGLSIIHNTSSTPIRDAIKSLEAKGFLEVSPRESIRVATMDQKTFKEVFELRIALECLAVEMATPNIPEDQIIYAIQQYRAAAEKYQVTQDIECLRQVDFIVHKLMLDHCDNKRLIKLTQDLSDLIEWARSIVSSRPHALEFALPEHLHILYAVRKRNIPDAQEAMRLHLRNAYRRTVESLERD